MIVLPTWVYTVTCQIYSNLQIVTTQNIYIYIYVCIYSNLPNKDRYLSKEFHDFPLILRYNVNVNHGNANSKTSLIEVILGYTLNDPPMVGTSYCNIGNI